MLMICQVKGIFLLFYSSIDTENLAHFVKIEQSTVLAHSVVLFTAIQKLVNS